MKNVFSLVLVLVVLLLAVAVYNGMIRVHCDDEKTVIEMDTRRMGEAAKESVDEVVSDTKEFVSDRSKQVDKAVTRPQENVITP